MENEVTIITSATSLPPSHDVHSNSNGNKRKEYSTPPSSANSSCQSSPRKLQKTSETYANCDILKGFGRTIELGGVNLKDDTSRVYGSSADLPILIIDSDAHGYSHLHNQDVLILPANFNLKKDPSRVYGTTADLPITIMDSDDIDAINAHQGDCNLHQKDALLNEPAHKLSKTAFTGMDCLEAKASKQAKGSSDLPIIILDSDDIDANNGNQRYCHLHQKEALTGTADELPETTLTRSDPEQVKASEQASESACEGIINDTQFVLTEKVGGSRDVADLKMCNIQTDLSANAGMFIAEEVDKHQINSVDDSSARSDYENDNLSVKALMDDGPANAGTDIFMGKDNILDGIDDGTDDRIRRKFKDLRELGLPSNCNIQLEETVSAHTEDENQVNVEDDLSEIWKEMAVGLECYKDYSVDPATTGEFVEEHGDECDHSLILKDDLGYVCRICGVIHRSIDTILEFQFSKGKRSTRTYEPRNTNNTDSTDVKPSPITPHDLTVTEISAHPKHRKLMKPHQVEGFKFLCNNLITDNPGGCIVAHAPGSGKTFMIISFIQSLLARYPDARPLIVLPKGILPTWKNEFLKWQVEEIPLHDFYSSKAENRSQQLSILRKWVKKKSILFLGYKQLSVIVCDSSSSEVADECKDILLRVPTILILDEGHTPRNEETDVLQSLSRVQTPRKVVLSGTLYQNHVKEVFNILNLVRPKFLRLGTSKMIVNRIMGRVKISRLVRKHLKSGLNSAFFESVEYTLQKDQDLKRRKAVIEDLREMTGNILHYYKGDFLDELPGLVDYTVVLNLSPKQKDEVQMLRKLDTFKRTSLGSAIYIHPVLKSFSRVSSATVDGKIDEILEGLDVREGVKAKFFLNILGLCESSREKLLVFSQYIMPLKLLERLTAKVKGWRPGREVFMITGDSNAEEREWCMEQFNGSAKARVFFGSIKACGEGISLVGASRILILDVHLNPSVTRQAIGRAFRPGQMKKVFTYRLIAADSPEQEDSLTCSRKESISKMWFEWNEYSGHQDFEMKTVDPKECEDVFFQSPGLREDLNVLYKR